MLSITHTSLISLFIVIGSLIIAALVYDFILVRFLAKRRLEISGPYHSSTWSLNQDQLPDTPITPLTPAAFSFGENLDHLV